MRLDVMQRFRHRVRRPTVCLAVAAVCLLGIGVEIAAQANNQAEESDRIDLGRLSEGPAIVGGGIVFGEPTGITAKLWFPETGFGLDAAVAWSFQDDTSLHLHANVIAHLALIETQGGRYIVPYVGLGITNTYGDDTSFGLRVPVGLSLLPFPTFPIEFFAELAPGIGLIPETDAEFGAGIGVRFYVPL